METNLQNEAKEMSNVPTYRSVMINVIIPMIPTIITLHQKQNKNKTNKISWNNYETK